MEEAVKNRIRWTNALTDSLPEKIKPRPNVAEIKPSRAVFLQHLLVKGRPLQSCRFAFFWRALLWRCLVNWQIEPPIFPSILRGKFEGRHIQQGRIFCSTVEEVVQAILWQAFGSFCCESLPQTWQLRHQALAWTFWQQLPIDAQVMHPSSLNWDAGLTWVNFSPGHQIVTGFKSLENGLVVGHLLWLALLPVQHARNLTDWSNPSNYNAECALKPWIARTHGIWKITRSMPKDELVGRQGSPSCRAWTGANKPALHGIHVHPRNNPLDKHVWKTFRNSS